MCERPDVAQGAAGFKHITEQGRSRSQRTGSELESGGHYDEGGVAVINVKDASAGEDVGEVLRERRWSRCISFRRGEVLQGYKTKS